MYSAVLGCDPGVTGGIAILRGDIVDVIHIPMLDGEVDVSTLVRWINQKLLKDPYIGGRLSIAYIEKTWNFSKGSIAIAKLNYVAGVMYGVLRTLDIPVVKVAPATWRKGLFGTVKVTKQNALDLCSKLYPELNITNHNLAESICVAKYGYEKENL
jgi:hypothetical protein